MGYSPQLVWLLIFFFISVSGNVSLPAKTSGLLFTLCPCLPCLVCHSGIYHSLPFSVLPPQLTLVCSLISAQLIYNHLITPQITKRWVVLTVDIYFSQFLEVESSKIKVPAYLVYGEDSLPGS